MVDLEADLAGALAEVVCGAVEPGRFAVTAGPTGEDLEVVWNAEVGLVVGDARKGVMRVVFGLFRLTLHDRDAGTRR